MTAALAILGALLFVALVALGLHSVLAPAATVLGALQ